MDTILITGAGRGIGAALHRQARRSGMRVIGTRRDRVVEGVDWHGLEVTDLLERFALLGPNHTGLFETWDGRAHGF